MISIRLIKVEFRNQMVALRTLKSEVAAGIKPEVLEEVKKSDSAWLTITPLLEAVQVNLVQPKSQLLANSQKLSSNPVNQI